MDERCLAAALTISITHSRQRFVDRLWTKVDRTNAMHLIIYKKFAVPYALVATLRLSVTVMHKLQTGQAISRYTRCTTLRPLIDRKELRYCYLILADKVITSADWRMLSRLPRTLAAELKPPPTLHPHLRGLLTRSNNNHLYNTAFYLESSSKQQGQQHICRAAHDPPAAGDGSSGVPPRNTKLTSDGRSDDDENGAKSVNVPPQSWPRWYTVSPPQ